MSSEREPCLQCGEPTPLEARICAYCRSSLLVDLRVDSPLADARLVYHAARALAELGGEAPEFLAVKQRLDAVPGVVVPGVTRGFARQASAVLEDHGIVTTVAPAAGVGRGAGRGPREPVRLTSDLRVSPVLAAVAFVAVLVGAMALLRAPGREGQRAAAPSRNGVELDPLSTRELAEVAEHGSVQLRIGPVQGAGFFVEHDLLVTNAHVVGGGDGKIEVVFSDGRTLYGVRERTDRWLDVALVRVQGARADRLELADVTGLRRGDQVMIMGNPEGLDFTAAQGIVSHPARVMMGICYLQLDASIHPGNSGGPVLDQWGRAVAIVSMMVGKAGGLALAVPVNYLVAGERPFLPGHDLEIDEEAWRTRLVEAADADQREVAELREEIDKPGLVGAVLVPPGMVTAVVVQRSEFAPAPESFVFQLSSGDRTLCRPIGEVATWRRLEDAYADMPDSRFLMWLERNGLEREVYAGPAQLHMEGCPDPSGVLGAVLSLDGASKFADRVMVKMYTG